MVAENGDNRQIAEEVLFFRFNELVTLVRHLVFVFVQATNNAPVACLNIVAILVNIRGTGVLQHSNRGFVGP